VFGLLRDWRRKRGVIGGVGVRSEPRDAITQADQTQPTEQRFGLDADLYRGRRLQCKQVTMRRGTVMGRRCYHEQWLMIYTLLGQIEIRFFRSEEGDPHYGIVATPTGEPVVIRCGLFYEILALTDVNMILALGNYTDQAPSDFSVVRQLEPDESP
jgi:hypothetical protein